MLGEKLGYSKDLFMIFSFFNEVPLYIMSGCAEPTCVKSCFNCKDGCNGGPGGKDPIEPV